jgi:hypothetical protein
VNANMLTSMYSTYSTVTTSLLALRSSVALGLLHGPPSIDPGGFVIVDFTGWVC